MSKKRLLILGAGVYQLPLVREAQKMGFEAIVVSIPGDYPAIDVADHFLPINTTDIKAVVTAAQSLGVAGVLTSGTDVAVPAIGAVVDQLGLHGTGFDAACRCSDKKLMKLALQAKGVPTSPFQIVSSAEGAVDAAKRLGYPVMVKAVDSSGSRGVSKVYVAEQLRRALQLAREVSNKKEVVVERFLDGVEFGAQAVVHGGKVVAVLVHNDNVTAPPHSTPYGHSMPTSLPISVTSAAAEVVERAVAAMGIRDTISNVDLMLVEGQKPMILEVGARIGATCLPEIVGIYTGTDMYEHIIHLALGQREPLGRGTNQPSAGVLLRSTKTGILKRVHVPGTVETNRRLYDLDIDVKPGAEVHQFVLGPHRLGHLVVTEDSASAAEVLAQDLANQISFEIDT